MREILLEIWDSMSRSKLRTFLTGFSVAWGIFMLVILLGSGNGLKNGMLSNFGDQMRNTFIIHGGHTSKNYAGYNNERRIMLTDEDVTILAKEFPPISSISATRQFYAKQLVYKDKQQNIDVESLTPEMIKMMGYQILEGRFINDLDERYRRKVVIIDQNTKRDLFADDNAIGKYIQIQSVPHKIVGVFKQKRFGNQNLCYVPLNTGKLIYDGNSPNVNNITMTVSNINTTEESENFEKKIIKRLATEHSFTADDHNAVWINNSLKQFQTFSMIFKGINLFVWIIGLGTMIAGVVGVSNIMLVTVRERTFEFGIRKALGAKPRAIIFLILLESVMITALFGYVGMVLGVAVMEVVNYVIIHQPVAETNHMITMFLNPTLKLSITVSATIVLIIAGLIAGYIPARRAARIKTIDALRFNK